MVPTSLIAEALAALRQLASAVPEAQRVQVAIREIERAAPREPLSVGVRGNVVDRTRLVDTVCGGDTFDRLRRSAGAASIRIRRGDGDRYIALRDDGPPEEHSIASDAPVPDDDLADHAEAEARRAEVAERTAAVQRAAAALPATLVHRPPWWAFWAWIARWLRSAGRRRELAAHAAATRALAGSRRRLAALTDGGGGRTAFVERLRELSSGARAGADVVEIALHVAGGPLPDGVEVVELTDDAEPPELDAVLVVDGTALTAPWAGDAEPVPVGDLAAAIAGLPRLLATARVLRLAGRARDALDIAAAELAAELDAATDDFAARIGRLEALRLPDPAGFAAAQLARAAPQIGASVSAVMEHGAAHLGGDLAELATDWITAIEQVSTGGELGAAVGKINDESAARMQQIAEDVRILVMGGVGGSVRDLYPDVVAPLRDHGLPEEHARPPRAVPALPRVEILPSLIHPSESRIGGAGWFAAIFRSLETRRASIREKVEQHTTHLQEVATAEMMEAEPKLHAALGDALAAVLATAIERQRAWLDGAIAAETAAIADDRAALAARAAARDAALAESRRLSARIAELGARHPAAAAAASHE